MLCEKESGVGVGGAGSGAWMTGRSVRKSQQPPSLERQEVMLRRWKGLVNGALDWPREPGCG